MFFTSASECTGNGNGRYESETVCLCRDFKMREKMSSFKYIRWAFGLGNLLPKALWQPGTALQEFVENAASQLFSTACFDPACIKAVRASKLHSAHTVQHFTLPLQIKANRIPCKTKLNNIHKALCSISNNLNSAANLLQGCITLSHIKLKVNNTHKALWFVNIIIIMLCVCGRAESKLSHY